MEYHIFSHIARSCYPLHTVYTLCGLSATYDGSNGITQDLRKTTALSFFMPFGIMKVVFNTMNVECESCILMHFQRSAESASKGLEVGDDRWY